MKTDIELNLQQHSFWWSTAGWATLWPLDLMAPLSLSSRNAKHRHTHTHTATAVSVSLETLADTSLDTKRLCLLVLCLLVFVNLQHSDFLLLFLMLLDYWSFNDRNSIWTLSKPLLRTPRFPVTKELFGSYYETSLPFPEKWKQQQNQPHWGRYRILIEIKVGNICFNDCAMKNL